MPGMSNKIFRRDKSDTWIPALFSNDMMTNQTTIFKYEITFTDILLDKLDIRHAKNEFIYKY